MLPGMVRPGDFLSHSRGTAHLHGLRLAAGLAGLFAGCALEQEGLAITVTRDDGTATSDASTPESPPAVAVPDARVQPRADAQTPAPVADAGCALSGTRALRLEAKVRWRGSALLDIVPVIWPGDGEVDVLAVLDMDGSGDTGEATIRACRARVPPFLSSLQEVYAVRFDDLLWDAIDTRWKTSFSRSCADPGCGFVAEYTEAQLGVELPPHYPWPGPRQPLAYSSLRDDDRDGVPGIPVTFDQQGDAGPSRYANPPAGLLFSERTREISLGLRVAVSLEGELESCARSSGRARLMTIDTRAHACVLEDGSACGREQVSFVNDNLPVWEVQSASWQLVDLAAGAGCAEARATLP